MIREVSTYASSNLDVAQILETRSHNDRLNPLILHTLFNDVTSGRFSSIHKSRQNLGLVMSDAQCLQDPRIGLAKSFGFSFIDVVTASN